MYSKNYEVLIDPTNEEVLEREPLLAFSFILSTRNNQLLSIADEIVILLDEGISKEFINGAKVSKAGILMWLWILGAYEIVRTMCQAEKCFSPDYISKLKPLKKTLAKVRMPDAKMEKQGGRKGKEKPVNSNRSPWAWDIEAKDLWIGDPEEPFLARKIIDLYASILSSLKLDDVLERHEKSYD